jgi:hypothetical protein
MVKDNTCAPRAVLPVSYSGLVTFCVLKLEPHVPEFSSPGESVFALVITESLHELGKGK